MAEDLIQPGAEPSAPALPAVESPAVEQVVDAGAPAVDAPAGEPAFTPHTETESLLEGLGEKADADKPVDPAAKPEDKPAVDGEAKPEVDAAAKPEEGEEKPDADAKADGEVKPDVADLVNVTELKLPEGLIPDPEKISKLAEILTAPEGTRTERAQKLMDLHAASLQAYADGMAQQQHKNFGDMRQDWRNKVMADPQLGGAGHQTTMAAVARMRDKLVPAANRPAFDEMLRVTGAGDHPEMLRMLHNAARLFDEPPMPANPGHPAPGNGNPGGKRSLRDVYNK